jgi:hypothetical protein
METPKYCLVVTPETGLVKVVDGYKGYFVPDEPINLGLFVDPTINELQRHADAVNETLGISKEEAQQMLGYSMLGWPKKPK